MGAQLYVLYDSSIEKGPFTAKSFNQLAGAAHTLVAARFQSRVVETDAGAGPLPGSCLRWLYLAARRRRCAASRKPLAVASQPRQASVMETP